MGMEIFFPSVTSRVLFTESLGRHSRYRRRSCSSIEDYSPLSVLGREEEQKKWGKIHAYCTRECVCTAYSTLACVEGEAGERRGAMQNYGKFHNVETERRRGKK